MHREHQQHTFYDVAKATHLNANFYIIIDRIGVHNVQHMI